MRDYATIAPQFWSGETGRELRKAGPNALLVAMYLLTTPHSNGLGLYHIPIMYMAHDINLGIDETKEALKSCINAGFCAYDYDADVVWVYNMARYQIGERLAPRDNRVTWVARLWAKLPKCTFLTDFKALYAEAYGMADSPSATGGEGATEAPPPEHGTWNIDIKKLNIPIGETANEERARSPERGKGGEGETPAPLSQDEPGMEFLELREFCNQELRPEGPLAGFAEYRQLKAARGRTGASLWPGLSRIMADICARKGAGVWNPGFEIGLSRYLREKTWLAPIQSRASPGATAAPTEFQRRQMEAREMARAQLARRERERELTALAAQQEARHGQDGITQ